MSGTLLIEQAEQSLFELTMFFVRHSLPHWPAQFAPVLQELQAANARGAIEAWSRLGIMGEHGLMQLEVSHEAGYRATDMLAEQAHFQRLLEQALTAMNNLRLYLRAGVTRPLPDIYRDCPL